MQKKVYLLKYPPPVQQEKRLPAWETQIQKNWKCYTTLNNINMQYTCKNLSRWVLIPTINEHAKVYKKYNKRNKVIISFVYFLFKMKLNLLPHFLLWCLIHIYLPHLYYFSSEVRIIIIIIKVLVPIEFRNCLIIQ